MHNVNSFYEIVPFLEQVIVTCSLYVFEILPDCLMTAVAVAELPLLDDETDFIVHDLP